MLLAVLLASKDSFLSFSYLIFRDYNLYFKGLNV